jgi:transposase
VRAGERTRPRWFLPFLEDVRHDVNVELKAGAACRCAKTAAPCREPLAREEALWTFAFVEGVEPTNNAGERAILPPVQYRKLS